MSKLKVATETQRLPKTQLEIPDEVMGGEAAAAAVGDWRTQLQPDSRERITDKIMGTLMRHIAYSGPAGLLELYNIAVRFEEQIYAQAMSKSEYLRKISLKMLTVEVKSQNPVANSLQSDMQVVAKFLQDPASLDSSSQTGNVSGADWQEETYQKIKSMNEMYFHELNEMYQRMAAKLHQADALQQTNKSDQLEKLRFFKVMLERLIMFLQTEKNDIQPNHKEKLGGVHKQIVNVLGSNRPRK